MKTVIFAATLGLILVSPALAQSYNPECGTGNICSQGAAQTQGNGTKARAEEPKRVAPAKRAAPAPSQQQADPNSPTSCGGGSSGYNEGCSQK